jgi:hypothetical protein
MQNRKKKNKARDRQTKQTVLQKKVPNQEIMHESMLGAYN